MLNSDISVFKKTSCVWFTNFGFIHTKLLSPWLMWPVCFDSAYTLNAHHFAILCRILRRVWMIYFTECQLATASSSSRMRKPPVPRCSSSTAREFLAANPWIINFVLYSGWCLVYIESWHWLYKERNISLNIYLFNLIT